MDKRYEERLFPDKEVQNYTLRYIYIYVKTKETLFISHNVSKSSNTQ